MIRDTVGRCEICSKPTHLTVDHTHSSGLVRGVLCTTCNTGIGAFMDDPKLLQKAVEYLTRTPMIAMLHPFHRENEPSQAS